MVGLLYNLQSHLTLSCRGGLQFQQYNEASELWGESILQQVSTLLHCLGEEVSYDLPTNIVLIDQASYTAVVAKFNENFKVSRNVILERAWFNQWNQLKTNSLWASRDKGMFQQLQLNPELILETAKKNIGQKEAVKE